MLVWIGLDSRTCRKGKTTPEPRSCTVQHARMGESNIACVQRDVSFLTTMNYAVASTFPTKWPLNMNVI